MRGIYSITNNKNGKKYVGQSTQIARRWRLHKASSKNHKAKEYNYPLYCAFRKYGINNFTFEVLEEVEVVDNLTLRELYWYEELNPEYNQVIPSKHIGCSYRIQQIDKVTLEVIAEFKDSVEAAKTVGGYASNMRKVANGHMRSTAGFCWRYIKDLK